MCVSLFIFSTQTHTEQRLFEVAVTRKESVMGEWHSNHLARSSVLAVSSFPDTAEMKMLRFVFFLNIMIEEYKFMFLILFKWIELIYWGLFFVPLKGFPILHVNAPLTALFNYIYTLLYVFITGLSQIYLGFVICLVHMKKQKMSFTWKTCFDWATVQA